MKLNALHLCALALFVACDDPVADVVAPSPSVGVLTATQPGLVSAVVDLEALQLRGGERPEFTNAARGLKAQFADDGSVAIEIGPGTGPLRTRPNDGLATLRMRTSAWGREAQMTAIAPVERARPGAGACDGTGRTTNAGRCLVRAEIERAEGAPTEWWANDERGLEQGWTFYESPPGRGLLAVAVEVEDWAVMVDDDKLGATFVNGADRVRYDGLRAWDADGVELASWMAVDGGELQIVVDDAGANYPVTVDPSCRAQRPGWETRIGQRCPVRQRRQRRRCQWRRLRPASSVRRQLQTTDSPREGASLRLSGSANGRAPRRSPEGIAAAALLRTKCRRR